MKALLFLLSALFISSCSISTDSVKENYVTYQTDVARACLAQCGPEAIVTGFTATQGALWCECDGEIMGADKLKNLLRKDKKSAKGRKAKK